MYAQALRGYSPYVESLTELDAREHAVRVVQFGGYERCHSEPRRASKRPTIVTLAHGTTPDGASFTIKGFFSSYGHNETFDSLLVLTSDYGDRVDEEGGGILEVGHEPRKPRAFPWSVTDNCPPREYVILDGILAVPGDTVLARTAAGLAPLTKVPIARHLRSRGPLVYGVFTAFPTELIVKRRDGRTLYTESLAGRARQRSEFCEGYAEPQ